MPTYNYACVANDCADKDVVHVIAKGMNDAAPSCRVCDSRMEQRFNSDIPVTFKGKGWFKTSGQY